MPLQQLNHPLIVLAVRAINRRAARVHVRVRISTAAEQHLRHLVLAARRAMPQRHAPGVNHLILVASDEPLPFIGIKAEIQKQAQESRDGYD